MQLVAHKTEDYLSQSFLKPLALSLVLAASAQINVLMVPVPITLQPLALLFIGLLASPRLAFLSVAYYLGEIAMGMPFASGFSGGLAALLSPKAGYFVGFLGSVYASAKLLTAQRTLMRLWMSAIIGTVILYACGVAWLSVLFGLEKALTVGLYPFVLEIPAFITVAVLMTSQINKLIQSR